MVTWGFTFIEGGIRLKLRVLWVTNLYHRPGEAGFRGIFVTQLHEALAKRPDLEIEVEVVAQDRGTADYLWGNARVRLRWDRGRFHLAHVHYGLTGLATLMLPSTAPIIATLYGDDINTGWQKACTVASLRRARRRIFVSKRLADQWPSPENVVLPNGIDFEVCRPIPRAEACAALGLDPEPRRVLFGGAPENSVKGYDLFREVLARVRQAIPSAEELILSQPGQSYSQVVTKLNAADCLLFTSRQGSEGSPTVVKESLAVGLPVVSVDVGDTKEMLSGVFPGGVVTWPAGTGELGRAALAAGLGKRVIEILQNRQRSDGREKRGALRQEEICAKLVSIYREVAGDSRPDLRYR